MIRGSRVAVILLGGVFVFVVAGILLLLEVLEERVDPVCLDRVAPPPVTRIFARIQPDGETHVLCEYTDGSQARIPRSAQRVASGLPGITEMVAFLGAADRLVAVSPYCDHPAELVRGIERVSVLPFDREAVLAVRPDLLLVDRRLHRKDLPAIRRRVAGVLPLDTSRSLAHLSESFEVLGRLLADDAGRARLAAWTQRKERLLADIAARHAASPPRVLVVAQWDPLYVLGRGALIDDLLRLLGCVNVACDLDGDASGTFSEELVLARRPDWILTPREPMPDRIRARWRNVPAVKQGRLTDGAADDLVRAGPRILDGLARLADVLLAPTGVGDDK